MLQLNLRDCLYIDVVESTKKKHKKNKRRHHAVEDIAVSSPGREESVSNQRSIKLKIKLGDQLISSSDATM